MGPISNKNFLGRVNNAEDLFNRKKKKNVIDNSVTPEETMKAEEAKTAVANTVIDSKKKKDLLSEQEQTNKAQAQTTTEEAKNSGARQSIAMDTAEKADTIASAGEQYKKMLKKNGLIRADQM